MSFVNGFLKMSNGNLPMEAAVEYNLNRDMQDMVPGSSLRGDAETGQFRGGNGRTRGVLNENKEFGKQYKRKAQSARGGHHFGVTISDGFSQDGNQQQMVPLT